MALDPRQIKSAIHQYRVAGASLAEIGGQIGISEGAVREMAPEDMAALEVERLDALQLAVWKRALQGSPRHVALALECIQMRAHLNGACGGQEE